MSDQLAYSAQYDAMYLLGNLHLIAKHVMVTNGCLTDAYFERSPLDVEPPIFLLMGRDTAPPGTMCTQLVHEIGHPVRLDVAWKRPVKEGDTILCRDRRGDHRVPIRIVKANVALAAGGGGQPDPLAKPAAREGETFREGVGYSNSYSLAEAINNAIKNLPPAEKAPPAADWLARFDVVGIGVEIGGIAGFDRLRVVVRTYDVF